MVDTVESQAKLTPTDAVAESPGASRLISRFFERPLGESCRRVGFKSTTLQLTVAAHGFHMTSY
jgi:hypothetical protein